MSLHVIVGAGPIGSSTATHLAAAGHEVRVITRSGTGPAHPSVDLVRADATDVARLAQLTTGADALYNCANPPYHAWPKEWPPLAQAMLVAAERSGPVLVTMSNLYGYGPVDGAMTPDLPLRATTTKGRIRAQMWRDIMAAHEAGRIRGSEVRASDYVGPGAMSLFTQMVLPKVRAGKLVYVPANVDLPHSLTYTDDAGRTLATVGTDERAWGRAWHVPTAPATTLRDAAQRYARIIGAPPPRMRTMSAAVLRMGGLFDPVAKEFVELRYQFTRPFVLDSSQTEETFGLKYTGLDDALRASA